MNIIRPNQIDEIASHNLTDHIIPTMDYFLVCVVYFNIIP